MSEHVVIRRGSEWTDKWGNVAVVDRAWPGDVRYSVLWTTGKQIVTTTRTDFLSRFKPKEPTCPA